MEIIPVAGVRIAPMIRSKETDLGLTDVYEVERSSRIGDETYTPSGARAETGIDDEEKNDDLEGEAEAEAGEERAGKIQVNYIA
jgi:hypothetical protein